MQDRPDVTPYTVGVQWRDGMVREGSFSIDEAKFEEFKAQAVEPVSREGLVLHMVAQTVEQIFASREQATKAKMKNLILPEGFRR